MNWIKFVGFKCEHCDTLWVGKKKKCPDCGKPMVKIKVEAPYGDNFFQQFFPIKNSPIVVPIKSRATHQISLQKQLSKIPEQFSLKIHEAPLNIERPRDKPTSKNLGISKVQKPNITTKNHKNHGISPNLRFTTKKSRRDKIIPTRT